MNTESSTDEALVKVARFIVALAVVVIVMPVVVNVGGFLIEVAYNVTMIGASKAQQLLHGGKHQYAVIITDENGNDVDTGKRIWR